MKTKKFDSIYNLISYYNTGNEDVIIELNKLHLTQDFDYSNFIEPFSKELNKNILQNSSMEYKMDVVRFYLYKLWEISGLYDGKDDLLFQSPSRKNDLDEFDNYIINSHFLFDMISVELQYCCGKFNIDFGELCKTVKLDTKLFDNGITMYFEDLNSKNKGTSTKNYSTVKKHEDIFSNNGFILFEHILKEYVKKGRGRLSDIGFFYWAMYDDEKKYIHQRPEVFKEWYRKTFDGEDLGKIKTHSQLENIDRIKDYSSALEWFKTQKL